MEDLKDAGIWLGWIRQGCEGTVYSDLRLANILREVREKTKLKNGYILDVIYWVKKNSGNNFLITRFYEKPEQMLLKKPSGETYFEEAARKFRTHLQEEAKKQR